MEHVPTIHEAGLAGFEASSWFGLIAPAKTPAAVVERLRNEVAAGLKDAEMQNRFAPTGARLAGNTPEQFAALIADDRALGEGDCGGRDQAAIDRTGHFAESGSHQGLRAGCLMTIACTNGFGALHPCEMASASRVW